MAYLVALRMLIVIVLSSKKIEKNNKKLLELRITSVKEQNKQQKPGGENTEKNLGIDTVKSKVVDLKYTNAKKEGHKADIALLCDNLGIAFSNLGDFRKAKNYYELELEIAKELGDRAGEGGAYGNLGIAFFNLGDFRKAIHYFELDLEIAKEVGDRAEVGDKASEGGAYGNLGIAFGSLGDCRKSIRYFELDLEIAKEVGDKAGEGRAYGNLGNAFVSLGDFRKAIDYYELHLKIAKEVGDKSGEGRLYGNLGIAFRDLGNFRTAKNYCELELEIANEVGDKAGEGRAYGHLGNIFVSLGDFRKAIDYYALDLKIAKEVGDRAGEGSAYGSLANAFLNLGDFRTAKNYNELELEIAKEVGDKAGEGCAYGSLGIAFFNFGDFRKAIDYYELHLKIAKEVGDKNGEANAYVKLGLSFESQGFLPKALAYYERSVRLFNRVRDLLQSKDEWKIGYRNEVDSAYTGLWRVLLKQDNLVEALIAAEKGRAQALTDLMISQFGIEESQSPLEEEEEQYFQLRRSLPSSTVFQAFDGVTSEMNFWVLSKDEPVYFGQKKIGEARPLLDDATRFLQSLIHTTYKQIGVRSEVMCENRSMDPLRENRYKADEKSDGESSQPFFLQESSLSTLYNIIIQPIADLVQGDELIIVPDGPLWLAPYAALMDADSKYLCELFRIRLIPSLTSLKLIADCPNDYHSRSGALLVGDPWIEEVTNLKGEKFLDPLPFARQEVEMIGKILNVTPMIGKKATKREVLKGLSSVALVHIAAHGRMETGEIALTPDSKQVSRIPTKEEDYILNMSDVLSVKMRARLVVLSCCHSGRGEIKAEGVVGIARAFMGAGARSVLVSLWAIDDEAALEFMKIFYHHLVEGRSASESLNKAMKHLRESDKYSDVRYWAPFVLIGDDVTLDFSQTE
ncbi:tetratricopeptide repeat protein 28-like [Oculina patagonica]